MKSVALAPAVLGLVVLTTAQLSAAKFIGLGQPYDGYNAVPTGVSADGQVIAGNVARNTPAGTFTTDSHPAMWMPRFGWTLLTGGDDPRVPFELTGHARDVSSDGTVIIGRLWNAVIVAVGDDSPVDPPVPIDPQNWTTEEGWHSFANLPVGEILRVEGVSASGEVIVGQHWKTSQFGDPPMISLDSIETFRWTAETGVVDLNAGHHSYAIDVSSDGSVVVGTWGNEAFRWTTESGMMRLGHLREEDSRSSASSVSADGLVVVGFSKSDHGQDIFRWTEETGMTGLGVSNDEVRNLGVSQDGSIIVFSHSDQPFIWDADNGTRDFQEVLFSDFGLDLPGWTLTEVSDLSDDGTIFVGTGINPDGAYESWMAVVPEPSSGVLAMIGLFGAVAWMKVRKSRQTGPGGKL